MLTTTKSQISTLFTALDANKIAPVNVQYTFESKACFAKTHRTAATIELANDTALLRQWNDATQEFPSFVVSVLPRAAIARGHENRYLVLVDTMKNSLFPGPGDIFQIAFVYAFTVEGKKVDPGLLNASRVDNPFADLPNHPLRNHAALHVSVQTFCEDGADKNLLQPLQLSNSLESIHEATVDPAKLVNIVIHKSDCSSTYVSEMAAISYLTDGRQPRGEHDEGPSPRAKAAFERLINFENPPTARIDIFAEGLEGMRNPELNPRIPQSFKKRFRDMDPDHRAAYDGLKSVPDRLHLVTGCPASERASMMLVVDSCRPVCRPPFFHFFSDDF